MQKIDLVYLWVDGNDPQWIESKRKTLMSIGNVVDSQPVSDARFVEHNELKYSLRSVEKYASWINKIFIVTADQTPSWLNVSHPKIEMVSHRDILRPEHLPTFNSHAIEMSIPLIKGLSERFLLANDDTFIAKPITPHFFYNSEGLPIARFARHISKKKSLYLTVVRRAQMAIEARYGKRYIRHPHHNIDAYLKSDVEACNRDFAAWVETTRSHKFRATDDLQRIIWLYWALAHKRAVAKIVRHYSATKSLKDRIVCLLKGKYMVDSRSFAIHGERTERRFRKYDPTLFCLNDNERAGQYDRECMNKFLEQLFPEKSSFEL